ncbi:MAG: ribosome small subunit-dependent GTPase A [Oscillospiraceae bacterium]|nr:ribosome small subunit-dependent GTPase A [Oscillospiraceae bacterium]
MIGHVVKSLAGFFYVKGNADIVRCRARGKFKADSLSPVVGDRVEYSVLNDGSGIIDKILPRKNCFIRPAVSNVDIFVFIASDSLPVTDPFLIDRVSVIASFNNCGFVLCINKEDIPHDDRLICIYKDVGFDVIKTSAVSFEGIPALREILHGKTCVFTGNSGIGKSSLINCLFPDAEAETADISYKLNRGKHTTRAVQSYDLGNDTIIIDTPGFSSFDVSQISSIVPDELAACFIDFHDYIGGCRFNDCVHINEPGCAVLEARDNGKIQSTRHESYCRLYDMLKSNVKSY